MFSWFKNVFTGKSYLNSSYINKVAKADAEEGLILDKDVPSVYEQRVINNFQLDLTEHAAEKSADFYALLESGDETKIVNFIDKAWQEEVAILNEAQETSNKYRKVHFKILRNEKNPAITLDVNEFLTYSYDLPKGIKTLLDYKAVLQARDDAKALKNKIETLQSSGETFLEKTLKVVQIKVIENYEASQKVPTIIQDYLDDKIEKPALQNELKELKAKEQKILHELYNSFYMYKNTLLQLLEEETNSDELIKIETLRKRVRLYYDVPLDLESIEEYSVIERAQNDVYEGLKAYGEQGTFSPYEYYLRDVHQEKIENYYETHGLQFRHMQDEDQILNDLDKPTDIKRNYHNPLIVQRGISFENRLEANFIKLINLYRMEYMRLHNLQDQENLSAQKLPLMLTLRYYFRNIEDETLSIEVVKSAATTDASIDNNTLDTATPFMYSMQKKHQKLLDTNSADYEQACENLLNDSSTGETEQALFSTHLEQENIILNQYHEFQLTYIREFMNHKYLQDEEKIVIDLNEDSVESLVPELSLYFDNLSSSLEMLTDEKIQELATEDAAKRVAQKRYPDFSYSERQIRNEFMYYLEDQKKRTAPEGLSALVKSITAKYNIKIDIYRTTYLGQTVDEEYEGKLFIFGYLPLTGEEIVERAIIDVKNRIESCVYIQDLIHKYKIVLEKNYQKYLLTVGTAVDIATGVNIDDGNSDTYKEYSLKEQETVMLMRMEIQEYQNKYTLFEKSYNSEYTKPTNAECSTYIELYFDNEITNEKTAQQAMRDLERGVVKAPTPYQHMITAYYQLKMHKLKKSYLNQIKDAQRNYISTGDGTKMGDLRSMESLEIEQIKNKYKLMMQHYLSYNTGIISDTITELV